MDCTPTKKEFAVTSTPRFSSNSDSGYFENFGTSAQKHPFFFLSPLKESSPQKAQEKIYISPCKNFVSPFKTPPSCSIINRVDNSIDLDSSGVIRQLQYDSGLGTDSLEVEESSLYFPLYPKVEAKNHSFKVLLNDYKLEKPQKRLDFLIGLKKLNCEHIISRMLSYLPGKDLCRCSCVSKSWMHIVGRDVKANRRRKRFLKKRKAQRENYYSEIRKPEFDYLPRYEPRLILSNLVNNDPVTNFKKNYYTKFESFLKNGQNIQNGNLMKCPRCCYAAKECNKDQYMCTECNYTFYKLYKNIDEVSSVFSQPSFIVGSKQSKRNLKRL